MTHDDKSQEDFVALLKRLDRIAKESERLNREILKHNHEVRSFRQVVRNLVGDPDRASHHPQANGHGEAGAARVRRAGRPAAETFAQPESPAIRGQDARVLERPAARSSRTTGTWAGKPLKLSEF